MRSPGGELAFSAIFSRQSSSVIDDASALEKGEC
jgi:hypothetical protein